MSYFDDQYEAWMHIGYEGSPDALEAEEVAEILADKAQQTQTTPSQPQAEEENEG